MPGFVVNFTDVKNFEALPAGVYTVSVINLEEVTGSPSGFPYFKTTLEIIDGEFAGRNLWSNLSLSPKAAWKLQEALLAFGESPEDLAGEFEFDPERYIGVECQVSVSQSSYEGRMSNTVDNFIFSGVIPESPKSSARKPLAAGRKPTIR